MTTPHSPPTPAQEANAVLRQYRSGLTLGELFTECQLAETMGDMQQTADELVRSGNAVRRGNIYHHPRYANRPSLHALFDGSDASLLPGAPSRYPECLVESDGGEA